MQWVAPSAKDTATDALEKRLWDAADQLHANSGLKSAEYSTPVLGLIFLFKKVRAGLEKMASSSRRSSRVDEPAAGQIKLGCVSIGEVKSPVPPVHFRNNWVHCARPMRAAAGMHTKPYESLRHTRDLLHPRLMSGQIALEIGAN